jgi:hypothetical protein
MLCSLVVFRPPVSAVVQEQSSKFLLTLLGIRVTRLMAHIEHLDIHHLARFDQGARDLRVLGAGGRLHVSSQRAPRRQPGATPRYSTGGTRRRSSRAGHSATPTRCERTPCRWAAYTCRRSGCRSWWSRSERPYSHATLACVDSYDNILRVGPVFTSL